MSRVLDRVPGAKPVSGGWEARCPAHDDQRASLSIGQGDDGCALVKCHAGCDASSIVQAIGLTMRDLWPEKPAIQKSGRIVKTYAYRDENGDLLFEVVRKEPKGFYQRRPNGSGDWINKLGDVRRVIYRLDVLHQRRPEALFVVEGEKDVESLESIGIIATTNPGGASKSDDKAKWLPEYSQQLVACGVKRLCILGDNDEAGHTHAQHVARICHDAGIETRILRLPDLREHGDATDWIQAGGTKGQLVELAKAAPAWTPTPDHHLVETVAAKQPCAQRTIRLTPASAIRVRPVHWLWQDRMPLGTLTLIGGREGIGKTILSYTIAADITRGRLPGVYADIPKSVIVAATEDSWEHTIVPRLMAAGADLDRVFRVDVATSVGTDAALSLPRDLDDLRSSITDTDAALVILDPLLSRLDSSLDTHKDAEVRLALEPIAALADACGVCVEGLIHVNKSTSTDVLTTLMASRAFPAVARAVLIVIQDPDDEQVRLLGQGKNNLGQMDLPALAFKIGGVKVADTAEGPVWTGKLEWIGESRRTLKDAVEAAAASSGDRTAMSEAVDWMEDFLASQDGRADSATIKNEGRKAGHSVAAIKRASKHLRVAVTSEGFPRRTQWALPVGAGRGETALTTPTGPTEDFPKKNTTHSRSTVGSVGSVGRVPTMDAPTGGFMFDPSAAFLPRGVA